MTYSGTRELRRHTDSRCQAMERAGGGVVIVGQNGDSGGMIGRMCRALLALLSLSLLARLKL